MAVGDPLRGTLILISVVAFAASGLNLGIDFEGGTQWQFTTKSGSASAATSATCSSRSASATPRC